MSKHRTIVDRLLSGEEYDESAIDDEIDIWHESATKLSLHEWLGFTPEEYELYVEKPELLRVILGARHYGTPLKELLLSGSAETLLAARGATKEEVAKLRQWLTATGRL